MYEVATGLLAVVSTVLAVVLLVCNSDRKEWKQSCKSWDATNERNNNWHRDQRWDLEESLTKNFNEQLINRGLAVYRLNDKTGEIKLDRSKFDELVVVK